MEWCSVDTDDARTIGARARMIRRRRGLSLDVVAGLAGISGAYLSMLEIGKRGFNRRGLIEDLADALGCSVMDLTGQPYLPPDRASAQAKKVIIQIERGLNEALSTTYRICDPDRWTHWAAGWRSPPSCGTPPATSPRARASTLR
jgi:transcriptional regulator with XRE-family HTH domain